MGMWRVAGSLLRSLQTSRPGIFGNIKSRMMKSGLSARALARPAAPSVAVEIAKTAAFRRFKARRSTTSFSSSTMRMRLLDTASMRARPDERDYFASAAGFSADFSLLGGVNLCSPGMFLGAFGYTEVARLFGYTRRARHT